MRRNQFTVSACPSCGSSAIRRVRGNWTGKFRGKNYTVRAIEYFACPNCQEKVYPPEAMRRIQASSPAYSKARTARRAS
jgi:YgiT-type zinc finger domain-containing protein